MLSTALGDRAAVNQFRPVDWEQFIGQANVINPLQVHQQAASERNQPLDHLLLSGPPGTGKTSIAQLLAHSGGGRVVECSGPTLRDADELTALLLNLERGDVLLIDEIHNLPPRLQELLYPAMEDCQCHLIQGDGRNTRAEAFPLEPFTLVGMTTGAGLLNQPLLDRFKHRFHMRLYETPELETIIRRAQDSLHIELDAPALAYLAGISRGTPRIALRFLLQVRDFGQVAERWDLELVQDALRALGIGPAGEDWLEFDILRCLCDHSDYLADPLVCVGLDSLAAMAGQNRADVERAEHYLMKLGLVERTPRGRYATEAGHRYLRKSQEWREEAVW